MAQINKEKFLEDLEETKDLSKTRFANDVEVWQYYDLRFKDLIFADECDEILGFKDKLTEKNLSREARKGNVNAIITQSHRLNQEDLLMNLYLDYGIEPFRIDNRKDMLAALNKVLSLNNEGKLNTVEVSEILDVLEERGEEIASK